MSESMWLKILAKFPPLEIGLWP